MEHGEAVKEMMAERYLLDELTPELRDAYEEHVFGCPECALDLRTGAAFINEAKQQLPSLTEQPAKPARTLESAPKRDFLAWLRPLFANPMVAGPVFAALLVVVGYQNLVTVPQLESAAKAPRLMPVTTLHGGTRSAGKTVIEADRKDGVAIVVDIPEQTGYSAYAFDLYDPEGKAAWNYSVVAAKDSDGTLALQIPGPGLKEGAYTLAVRGIGADGTKAEIERDVFEVHFKS